MQKTIKAALLAVAGLLSALFARTSIAFADLADWGSASRKTARSTAATGPDYTLIALVCILVLAAVFISAVIIWQVRSSKGDRPVIGNGAGQPSAESGTAAVGQPDAPDEGAPGSQPDAPDGEAYDGQPETLDEEAHDGQQLED